jgi:hypothetical protein
MLHYEYFVFPSPFRDAQQTLFPLSAAHRVSDSKDLWSKPFLPFTKGWMFTVKFMTSGFEPPVTEG